MNKADSVAPLAIRFAQPTDLEAIVQLHRRAWLDAYQDVMPQARLDEGTSDFFRARWKPVFDNLDPPRHSVLVAEIEGRIGGVVRLSPAQRDQQADLTYCHVDPSLQSTGVGSALVEALTDLAKRAGYRTITIWVVDGNSRGLKFWERNGWHPTGESEVRSGEGWQVQEIRCSKPLDLIREQSIRASSSDGLGLTNR